MGIIALELRDIKGQVQATDSPRFGSLANDDRLAKEMQSAMPKGGEIAGPNKDFLSTLCIDGTNES